MGSNRVTTCIHSIRKNSTNNKKLPARAANMGLNLSLESEPTNQIPINTCSSLFLDEKFADFHFAIDSNGEKVLIPAHKILLAKGSPVFECMFYGEFNQENEISITDTSFDELKEFLQFFYLQKLTLTFENMPKVMELLDKYLMSGCLAICEMFLFQHVASKCSVDKDKNRVYDFEGICFAHQLCFTYKLVKLGHICLVVAHKFPREIFNTESFRQCSQDFLRYILDVDGLSYVPTQLLDACIDWAKYKCEEQNLDSSQVANLRKQLGDCLYYIQFGLMTHKQLFQCIATHKGLFNHEELEEIVSLMSNDSVELNKFKRKPLKEWNDRGVLQTLENVEGPEKILNYVNQAEIFSFRTNQVLLLGAIDIFRISCENRFWSLNGTMTLMNRISYGDDAEDETNILLEQCITLSESRDERQIKLSKPIICHPGVNYVIQIIFDSSWVNKLFSYYEKTLFELQYEHEVKVVIQKPSVVSQLFFNVMFTTVEHALEPK